MFDGDGITLAICGDASSNPAGKLIKTNCIHCLAVAGHLAMKDTYKQAIAYVKTIAPDVTTPDPEVMAQRHSGEHTKLAKQHIANRDFLRNRGIESPADIPKHMIGGNKEIYHFNMIENDLVHGDADQAEKAGDEKGGPVQATLDWLNQQIEVLTTNEAAE